DSPFPGSRGQSRQFGDHLFVVGSALRDLSRAASIRPGSGRFRCGRVPKQKTLAAAVDTGAALSLTEDRGTPSRNPARSGPTSSDQQLALNALVPLRSSGSAGVGLG